jgi:hypothetical protein
MSIGAFFAGVPFLNHPPLPALNQGAVENCQTDMVDEEYTEWIKS